MRLAREREPGSASVVWFRAGDYTRTSAFDLGDQDSGRKGAPVRYAAYRGEAVRWLGGQVLRQVNRVSDPKVRERFAAEARSQILEFPLDPKTVSALGVLKSRGFGRPLEPSHSELFFDHVPMTLARWPNRGMTEKIAGFPDSTGAGDEHGGRLGALEAGFYYAGDRPRSWAVSSNIWVHGYWAWDWANSYERVEVLDGEKRFIKTAAPHGLYGFRKGQHFHFLNVLEELDEPGEWYLDASTARVYFWPPTTVTQGELYLSTLGEPFVRMAQVSHVEFEGIQFEGGRNSGVVLKGASDCGVVRCDVRSVGNYGILVEGGTSNRVDSCTILDTGDGGVSLTGGDRSTLARGEHRVTNTHFMRQGRWSKCYVPAVLMSGVGHRVDHNLIQDHPHCAILYSGNDHVIEFNEISHVARETGDVGAIYSGRDWTYRGNKIRHNYIHDTGGVGMGSMGVYMDDCVSGTEIFGNVFARVSRAAFLGGGRDHQVVNNLFIDCKPAVQIDGRGMDRSPVWHNMVYDYMRKQMDAVPQDLYLRRYPALGDLKTFYASDAGIPPEKNVIANNISLGGKWLEIGWHAKVEAIAVANNLVASDDTELSLSGRKLRLKRTPTGFQSLRFEEMGLRSSRRSLQE